ncbi:RNA polymerase sigma-70 factor [Echinicola marina]|uniref:RNA polymerase sigma-70 factor n=1 Tax=Echinicola marina TaxID=2859768 RepID=UPI001CF683F5|nr:RNA polymerase sigma-70 factor [Echinicola marina]UCS94997.1 RNA polymerase sigma-70 factor [Echinicola marina]
MLSSLTNKELLFRISANADKRAFGELFKRYHSKLISFALCYMPNFEEAEDVVSDVFVKLLKKRDSLSDIENFEGYIYFSVKNQCLNQVKRNQRKNQLFSIIDFDDIKTGEYVQPLDEMLTKELRNIITGIVESLPHKRRLVFKMIKDEGLKISEVAKLLDIAEKTVKKHLELAVKDLRLGISDYLSSKDDSTKIVPLQRNVQMIWLAIFMAEVGIVDGI